MEPEEPLALYDFLYKDMVLCNSLYSQIFKGLLTSSKNSTQSDMSVESIGKVGLKVAEAERKKAEFSRLGIEESLDPHDIIVLEAIAKIAPSAKRINDPDLKRGDVVIATGQLHIFNRPHLEAALDAFEQVVTFIPKSTPNKKLHQDEVWKKKAGIAVMRKIMGTKATDARYVMFSDDTSFSGMLKESEMTVSLESIAYCFSGEPIDPITLIGIVERPGRALDSAPPLPFPKDSLYGIMAGLAPSLSQIGLNSDTLKPSVKPIVVYSQLNI